MSEIIKLRNEGRLTNSPTFATVTVGTVVWPLESGSSTDACIILVAAKGASFAFDQIDLTQGD
jgi:hypothetical protein